MEKEVISKRGESRICPGGLDKKRAFVSTAYLRKYIIFIILSGDETEIITDLDHVTEEIGTAEEIAVGRGESPS